ncbi:hypothetical protein H8D36_06880 [archaeon]|nr:hypothetical protein [archaeon]
MKEIDRIEEGEIAIIAGASRAIKEFQFGEMPDEEKVMLKVIDGVEIDHNLQHFVIAGANFALKKKIKNTKLTERQIMQMLSEEVSSMMKDIGENN